MRLNQGFSLIEILVSLVILSIGLLGVAALQMGGLRYSQGAYQQSQASVAIADLVDRMRANPDFDAAASVYQFDTTDTDENPLPSDPGCVNAACSPTELAQHDVRQWNDNVLSRLGPATSASVTLDDGQFTITVQWADMADRDATDVDGDGDTDEAGWRSMTTVVRI